MIGDTNTLVGIAYTSGSGPTEEEESARVDKNLVWKATRAGNTIQTGECRASRFVLTDGTVIGGSRAAHSGDSVIGLVPTIIWNAESPDDIIQIESDSVENISVALGQNTFIQLFYSTGDSDMPFNSRLIKLSDLAITDDSEDKADYTLAIFSVDGSKKYLLS